MTTATQYVTKLTCSPFQGSVGYTASFVSLRLCDQRARSPSKLRFQHCPEDSMQPTGGWSIVSTNETGKKQSPCSGGFHLQRSH